MRWFAALAICLAPAIHAQTTGGIQGVVQDASRHPVAGAKVTVRSEGTAGVRNLPTDSDGRFAFASVPVGGYTVEIEADSFKTYVRQSVDVTLGHVVDIPVQLEVGDSTKVLALETPLVERTSSQIGAVADSRMIVDLPLNTRDAFQFLQLQPGVQSQQGYDLFAGSENAGVVSVNGGRGRANNFNVNGGEANDLFIGVPGVQPAPDAIEEFRVLTNGFDAEFGRNSGSVVNVVTKSGAGEFHGDVFEFFRNRALNSRGFFDAAAPKFNQNQFGATVGGPIRKDGSYFFFSAENRRIRRGISSDQVTVPTLAERGGDFSGSAPFAGTLNDEFLAGTLAARPGCLQAAAENGGAPMAAGASWAAIFPGNRIPAQCFDATAIDLLDRYVPRPSAGSSTFAAAPVLGERAIQPTLRIDHTVSQQNLLTFYYYADDSESARPFSTFQAAGANLPGFGSDFGGRSQQVSLSDIGSFGASVVNEARFAYYREAQQQYNHPQNVNLVQDSCAHVSSSACFSDPENPRLGISPGLGFRREGLPFIQLSGGFSIGNNPAGELPQVGNTFQWADTLSVARGQHRMKFGADVRRQRFDQTLYYNTNGSFTFNAGGANGLGGSDLVSDYLLGLPNTYSQGSAQTENVRSTALALFAQDAWSVARNVTLNYGLRWELATPMRDARNRLQAFRPGAATRTHPCRLDPSSALAGLFGSTDCNPGDAGESVFPLGLVVPGDPGVPGGLVATYYKSFAPRIGMAWSPSVKTSVRASWGMFYNPIEQLVLEQFSGEPPFGGTTSLSNTMFNTPFLGQDGSVQANPFHGIMTPNPGQSVDWSSFRPIELFGDFQPQMRTQYSVNYNLTVQRQVGKDLLLQVGYVGSQGHRLLATHDLNYGLAAPCLDLNSLAELAGDPALACGPFSADSAYTVAANEIPAGFTLHLPYGPAGAVTGPNPNPITLVGLRPYSSPLCNPLTGEGCPPDGVPVFGSIFAEDTVANSSYNSFQAAVEKRAFSGLQFQAAYTWSKSIDNASSFENLLNPLNYGLSRSLSLFDARHRLALSYRWPLPGIHGRFGSLLSGWTASGILILQSGLPVPITSTDDLELMSSLFYTSAGEPDRVAPFKKLDPRNPGNLAFDPSAFRQPGDMGRVGNSPRSVCCGPGIANLDFSLMKSVQLQERSRLQFRAEFFNLANHAQFGKVDGNISDGDPAVGGTFGKALGARDPRLIQLALKVLF